MTRADGAIRVDLGDLLVLLIRECGASALSGEGIIATTTFQDGAFATPKVLRHERFTVTVIGGQNVWTREGHTSPSYTDAELAAALLP